MDPSCYEMEIRRQDLVKWCIEDREELKKEFFILRPHHQGRPPALWIEELLGVLGYKVCFLPMERTQLGLCDFGNRHISINARLKEPQRRHTMAHELGHCRLHEREIGEQTGSPGYEDDEYELSRRSRRENEADLYAAIFLVSRRELEKQELILELLESRRSKQHMTSNELWSIVYGLAKSFAVSPIFMLNCLVALDWLEKTPSRTRARKSELKLKWRAIHDD